MNSTASGVFATIAQASDRVARVVNDQTIPAHFIVELAEHHVQHPRIGRANVGRTWRRLKLRVDRDHRVGVNRDAVSSDLDPVSVEVNLKWSGDPALIISPVRHTRLGTSGVTLKELVNPSLSCCGVEPGTTWRIGPSAHRQNVVGTTGEPAGLGSNDRNLWMGLGGVSVKGRTFPG